MVSPITIFFMKRTISIQSVIGKQKKKSVDYLLIK